MTCDERRDNLLLYVADALDPSERAEVRSHLSGGCVVCAARLAVAAASFAAVGMAVEPVLPSAEVRRRVMAAVAGPAVSRPSRNPWFWRVAIPVATAAFAAAATFAVVLVRPPAFLRQAMPPDPALAVLRDQLRQRDQAVADLQGQVGRDRSVVDALLKAPADVVRLTDGGPQPKAAAWLVWDRPLGRWVLLADHLTPPPAGKTFELWYVTVAGRKVRAGTFDVATDGSAAVQTRLPADLGPLALAAVTDEPAGGSDAPTGKFQLTAKLP